MYKYEEIARELQEKIMSKKLLAKEKLPNLRDLAADYQCSIGTIIKAYQLLKDRRLIYQKRNSGYFVVEQLLSLSTGAPESQFILDSGNPTSELFASLELFSNFEAAGQLYRRVSRNSPMRGNDSLINYLPHFLAEQSIYVSRQDIYLCLGILHAFTLLAKMPFPNGKKVILIEEPTYHDIVEYLRKSGLPVQQITRHQEGLDLIELETLFKSGQIKFFYIVPRNHNPYGSYLPYQQRKKIMALAKKYDVYIVEDDYLAGYDGLTKYEPLFYHSKFSHCLYLQSFSKILPMLRIGFIILPKELREAFHQEMLANYYSTYYTPSLLAQAILETHLRSSAYPAYRQRFIAENLKKIRKINCLTSHWQQEKFTYHPPQSGFYSTVHLAAEIELPELISNLASRQVYVKANRASFYDQGTSDNSLRLSHAQLNYEEIPRSYQIIYEELQKAVKGLK